MTRIIENIEMRYETHEVPFGRSYEWQPEQVIVECDCGEELTLTATSTTTAVGAALTMVPSSATSNSGKVSSRIRSPTPGTTTPESRRKNTNETKLLILRTRLGAITTLR